MRLRGKVAIVTGAGSGIGLAVATRFAAEGARVAIAEVNQEKGEAAARQLAGTRFYRTDVRSGESIRTMVDQVVADFGQIDILVNNAGLSRQAPSLELTEESWRETIDIMQTGSFLCAQATARQMVPCGSGCILNMASIHSVTAMPGRVAYGTAKAALVAMTRIMAVEWAPLGLRVNAISPGVTETPLVQENFARGYSDEAMYLSRIPMGRLARPEEIAAACAYLASDEAAYITGHNLVIDGGWTPYGWIDRTRT